MPAVRDVATTAATDFPGGSRRSRNGGDAAAVQRGHSGRDVGVFGDRATVARCPDLKHERVSGEAAARSGRDADSAAARRGRRCHDRSSIAGFRRVVDDVARWRGPQDAVAHGRRGGACLGARCDDEALP